MRGFHVELDAKESENLHTVLSRIEREQYFDWILEKSHTRSEQGKLVALDISWLGIRDLPSDFLDGLDHLRDLRFDNNPQCDFEDNSLSSTTLSTLKLLYCQLTEFPAHTIAPENNLQFLELSYNPIRSTQPENFVNLQHLIELDLHNCELSRLDSASFRELGELRLLNLNFNAITELTDRVFSDLHNLQLLTMENNQLQNIQEGAFEGLARLEELMLPYNQIQVLPEKIFQNLKAVKTISLIHNQLFEINTQFSNLPNLTSLNLQMNLIQSIPESAFQGTQDLIHLSLESNQLKELPSQLFDSLHQLEFLNINNNPLSIETALQLPVFSKFDYTSIIYENDADTLHDLITTYPQNESFVLQALHSGKLMQKTKAFIRLLGYAI